MVFVKNSFDTCIRQVARNTLFSVSYSRKHHNNAEYAEFIQQTQSEVSREFASDRLWFALHDTI